MTLIAAAELADMTVDELLRAASGPGGTGEQPSGLMQAVLILSEKLDSFGERLSELESKYVNATA